MDRTRLQRLRSSRRTLEIVSWTIGVLTVLVAWLALRMIGHQLGWTWP
ncbi:MAG TPA: hypothetical protein VGK78_15830 [Nocardioides sp.]